MEEGERVCSEGINIAGAHAHLSSTLEIFEPLGTLIQPDKLRDELAGLPEG